MPRQVVMIGGFPPPVGGAAKNNQLLYESLRASGVEVVKLDTSAASLSHRRSFAYHMQRIWRNFIALLRARALGNREATLYLVPDGGYGAWYTLGQVRASSRLYERIIIHHRTFRYIDHPSRPMSLLARTRPEATTHVFLSAGMARAFQDRYGPVRNLIASNARFVMAEAASPVLPRMPGPLRIGHLSNLCREKGFFLVTEAFETIRKAGIDAELHLAGPVIEPEVEWRMAGLRETYGSAMVHAGPLTGAAKLAFYRRLDVFLFPTQFAQEASPNVVYEALAAGVPVVATRRGCIPEIIDAGSGILCDPDSAFAGRALEYVRATAWDESSRAERSARIKTALKGECRRSLAQYDVLMGLLGAKPGAEVTQEF